MKFPSTLPLRAIAFSIHSSGAYGVQTDTTIFDQIGWKKLDEFLSRYESLKVVAFQFPSKEKETATDWREYFRPIVSAALPKWLKQKKLELYYYYHLRAENAD
ncbi:hypothetical protein ABKN59_010728 [Abortiporus biennis]